MQDGRATVYLPLAVVSLVQKCCLLTLIARCLLYSPATSCLWYSIIIVCILQRRRENASPLPLLFHQDLFYFCSVSFICFHWPAVCLYSHIKVTFATLFPPKPPPLFLVWRPERETQREGGLLHIFSRQQYNTWHVEHFSMNNGNTIA